MSFEESDAQNNKPALVPATLDEECESMDSKDTSNGEVMPQPVAPDLSYPVIFPAYFSPYLQIPFPRWPGDNNSEQQTHEVIKPTAVHSTTPINVDELVGMSKLSIGESDAGTPSSLHLLGVSKRQSAFQANPSTRTQI